jgi:hypothetical protein
MGRDSDDIDDLESCFPESQRLKLRQCHLLSFKLVSVDPYEGFFRVPMGNHHDTPRTWCCIQKPYPTDRRVRRV